VPIVATPAAYNPRVSAPAIPVTPVCEAPSGPTAPSGRLLSLDVFRGATIAAMILVNDGGDEQATYWPLLHAHWNGWTPTDLVFPFFVLIVGVSLAYSLRSRLARGVTRAELVKHILWRGAVIFALGLFLNGFPNRFDPSSWRVYGVLQRIAVCYVVSAILALFVGRRSWIAISLACLFGYWALMRLVPVPGFGVPTLDIPLLDPDKNLAAWLDRKLLMGHLYEVTRDPEGVLSTIPAIATSLIGLLAGDWLRTERSGRVKALGLALWGAVLLAAGQVWNAWFPINKKLWTSSYVLFTGGLALACLALCYWAADLNRWRRWATPFLVFGTNAIAAYMLSELVAHLIVRLELVQPDGTALSWQEMLYQRFFLGLGSPANASLAYALVFTGLCWAALWVLYRRKIFLKI
jgi:predicted acyltransferase